MTNPQPARSDTTWMDDARCRPLQPEVKGRFHSGEPLDTEWAKHFCHTCPVQGPCLQWALTHHEDDGVWGGTSGRERRRLRPFTP
jgi:hypothetical protein